MIFKPPASDYEQRRRSATPAHSQAMLDGNLGTPVKQVLQNRSGLTVVREVPLPPCPPAGILVNNAFSAISSGTERTAVESGQKSLVARARERPDLVRQTVDLARRDGIRSTRDQIRRKLDEEAPSGYSSAGRVMETGPRVRGIAVGDLVACAGAGHANHAQVVAVPSNLCAKVPEGVPMPAAALTTLAAIALHAVRLTRVAVAERAAVIGCGLIGQIACRLLAAAGAEVIALDIDHDRVQSALREGADHGVEVSEWAAERVRELTRGIGVDHAIVTAGAPTSDPLVLGTELLRERGSLTLVGAVPIHVPREQLYMKELTFQVSRSYGPGRYDAEYEERGLDYPIGFVRWTEQRNMEAVLSLQARGKLTLHDLIEDVIPVERANEAYARITGPAEQRPRGALILSYHDLGEQPIREGVQRSGPAVRTGSQAPAIGLVGYGQFASQVLVPAFTAAGGRLELVGGGMGPSAEAAARQLGSRVAESEQAVIEDGVVDVVVIGTRHGSHAELAGAALREGKHVFCEKPLALSLDELSAVMTTAEQAEGILAVGFNRRFSPLAMELRRFLAKTGGPTTILCRVSAGKVPPSHWVHDLEQGGGRVLGEVCHFIDTLVFLVNSPVTEVHASGFSSIGAPAQARDNVAVTLQHADGSLGTIVYIAQSSAHVGKERIEAFGQAGIGILDDYRSLELNDSQRRLVKVRGQEKGHSEEIVAFMEGVRSGRPPVPLPEVANVSLATLAVVESMKTGASVRIDAVRS